MKLFDKFKPRRKAGAANPLQDVTANGVALSSLPDEPLDPALEDTYGSDELCENGELPLGWTGRHYKELKGMEENVSDHVAIARDVSRPIDERVEEYETAISLYNRMKERFIAAGECYAKYFADMWEHCHNSRCSDFVYIDPIKEDLALLRESYEALKKRDSLLVTLDADLLGYIKSGEKVLQADVYKNFDPVLKADIQDRLYTWAQEGRVHREKSGRSYLISLPRS